jgi:uncharacterized protein
MAERLAELEKADLAIVRAAALLHDISRPGDESAGVGADHALLAAQEARRILAGDPPEFVEAVAHAIEAHRFRNDHEPETLEARIVFDADKLDAIGAVGVARAFAYGSTLGQPLWGDVSEGYLAGRSQEAHTAHHEFHVKLKHLADRLYTDSGRRIAEGRHRFMVAFFEQMAAEIRGER